jgi:hypothetical protein
MKIEELVVALRRVAAQRPTAQAQDAARSQGPNWLRGVKTNRDALLRGHMTGAE